MAEILEDLFGSEIVQARHPAFHVSFHSECFARAGLPVGKAGHLGAKERTVNQRLDAFSVNFLVFGVFIEGVIEVESGLLDVFC